MLKKQKTKLKRVLCMSRGKKEWNCWSSPNIFGSRDTAGKIIIKITINTITQIWDKATNKTQDQIEFEGCT